MQMRRYLWLMLLLSGSMLTACAGGSGSSGFDVRSENAAIQTALAEQRCVQHESLTICPAGEASASPEGSPTPSPMPAVTPTPTSGPPTPTATQAGSTFTPGSLPTATVTLAATRSAVPTSTATASPTMIPAGTQQVEVALDPSTPITCVVLDQKGSCGFSLSFSTHGFPLTATFRVAWRTVAPNGGWTIGPALAPIGATNPSFDAPVDLNAQVDGAPGVITAQAAVLVFLNPAASVRTQVSELIDTGADAAFVTNPFTLQPNNLSP
ncbi:MAG: hypothetical protein ACHQ9S_03315 [Candidatus Binatia bacterium]